ncbi:MAG TPA: ATP-binding protein [Burkholderiales bacterium]|nr:ATP-binding protein [Burkholderiales bacterium]
MRTAPMIGKHPRADATPPSLSADELSRFERLLLDLSAGFINLPAARIDGAIDDGLRRIVEALGIDRSTLNSKSPATGRVEITHSYAVPGVARAIALGPGQELWPWAWALLNANRPVVFARLDDLPPEASIDRANYERIGLKSHVTMPMIVDGELYGGLSFGSVRRERTWPEELLERMRLLAQIFGSALARKRAQDELREAIGFERLASSILASLLLARPGDEGGAIEQGLKDIGLFLGVQRVSLWERVPGRDEFRRTHLWRVAGVSVLPATLDLPWVSVRLLRGSVVRFTRDTELPPEAADDLPKMRKLGVRSLLAVPFLVSRMVAGVLFFASTDQERAWPEGLIPGVSLLAEVFASLHARRSAERRKQAAEVEAAQWRERLAHLVRVHTAGEMSAALAHEITQPLGAIENYALAARRRIGDESPDLARVADLLDKVIGQATRAGDVVTRMRGMVQRHELEPREIDVARAVGACVDMVKTDCELRDIRIELKAADGLPVVVVDEIHLQQVVLNLLRNAMEAVELPHSGVSREIRIEVRLDGADAVSVQVADRGAGIAEGDLERVFESFYSTKPTGLGVGLAICRKLIEAHGGALRATHNPGGGAVFQLTLPVAAPTD